MMSTTRGTVSLAGVAWLFSLILHCFLQGLSRGKSVFQSGLPGWAKLALLCNEFVALAFFVALAALLFHQLAILSGRAASRWRPLLRGLRILVMTLLLMMGWATWGMFWMSGRFLDLGGLRFVLRNSGDVYGYVMRSAPIAMLVAPFVLVAAAFALCEAVPAWALRVPERVRRIVDPLAIAVLGGAVLMAIVGEVGIRVGNAEVEDPATGLSSPRSAEYSARRQGSAGPLTHLAIWMTGRGQGDLFEDRSPPELYLIHLVQSGRLVRKPKRDFLEEGPPEQGATILRRPIVPMDQYLSTIDRAALRRWNVIVVLIDSFRADQLRATGGTREVMPALEALAKEGRSYPDCYTVASHTDYAAPSPFSSHYPLRHRFVHRYPKDPAYPRVMIYDVLQALGWRTAFFSSQNEDWGGAMNYYQTGSLEKIFHPQLPDFPARLLRTREKYTGSIDDGVTLSEALEWTEAVPDKPFFLYLNLQNAHLPFPVPDDFPRRFATSPTRLAINAATFPRENVDVVKEIYADSLAYVDTQLERMFDRLKKRGLWDRTLIVVTGDHGEAFYEHGHTAHANSVYQEEVRIPLVVRAPLLEPLRDPRPALLIDVAPTVFHLLGLPIHPSFQGVNLMGPAHDAVRTRALLCQTGWKTYMAAVRSGFKLVRDGQTGGSVLYDLVRDPGERTDVSSEHPEEAQKLRSWLKTWRWAQVEYYENPERWSREYPPVVGEP